MYLAGWKASHDLVLANCTASCEDVGRGTCEWSESYQIYVCICANGWTRDNMHVWNVPISCTTPVAGQLVIDVVAALAAAATFAGSIRLLWRRTYTDDEGLLRLTQMICATSAFNFLYDVLRFASLDFSVASSLLHCFYMCGAFQVFRAQIIILANKAFGLLHEDVTKLKGFVVHYARIVAWSSHLMDITSFILFFARFWSISGWRTLDIDALNEGCILQLVFCCMAIIITTVNFVIFASVLRRLLNTEVQTQMSDLQINEFKRRSKVLTYLLKNLGVTLFLGSIVSLITASVCFKAYMLDNEELDNVWLCFAVAQFNVAFSFLDIFTVLPKFAQLAPVLEMRGLSKSVLGTKSTTF